MKKLWWSFILPIISAVALNAAELGDPAAALDIKDWIKGSPVDLAAGKGKTVFVVEFWATWCPPCRTSIPHLTEMQKKFKDKGVVFIGVSTEKTPVVKKFVDKMGETMDYTVAVDGGKTSEGYMEAYGINGIPHAFIVGKDGNIMWHGHPMDQLEETLDKIIEGKYDIEAAKDKAKKQAALQKRQREIQQKLQKLAEAIIAGDEGADTRKLEEELAALDKEFGGILNGENFDPADFRARVLFSQKVRKYQQAMMSGRDASEIADLEKELKTGAPKGFDLDEFKRAMAQRMEMAKASSVLDSYMEAVGESGDAAKAAELAKKIEALELKDPQLLNQIAWTLLTEDSIKQRDTKLALNLAKRANDLSEGREAGIVDTYARALFDNGSIAEAIAQQKKAIDLADEEDLKAQLKKNLQKYEAGAKGSK